MKTERRSSDMDFPENLIAAVGTEKVCGAGQFVPLTAEQTAGLEYALSTLKPREADMLLLHFKAGKTYDEIGPYYGISRAGVYQVITKTIRKLRHPSRLRYYAISTPEE